MYPTLSCKTLSTRSCPLFLHVYLHAGCTLLHIWLSIGRTNEGLVLEAARLDGVKAAAPLQRAHYRPLPVRGDCQGTDLRVD